MHKSIIEYRSSRSHCLLVNIGQYVRRKTVLCRQELNCVI